MDDRRQQRRPRAWALLLAAWLAALGLVFATAAYGLASPEPARTYGPEYLAGTKQLEVEGRWYSRQTFCREVYHDGRLVGAEVTRTVDLYRGPAVAYGPPQVAGAELKYQDPPHLHLVTTYERTVYRFGRAAGAEPLPELTRVEDACRVSEGPPFATEATMVTVDGAQMIRVSYSVPVYHHNPRYGSFLVGHRGYSELVPAGPAPAGWHGPVASGSPAPGPSLEEALRSIGSVAEFRDYLAVQQSPYRRDIEEAFQLGLIVGKYDHQGRFYDPGSLITLGEMVNILARNHGAANTVQGAAAVAYLGRYGVTVLGDLGSPLSMAQLQAMATQLERLDLAPRADLVVMRQARAGGLSLEDALAQGITREYAVAMYRPVASLPVPAPPPGPAALDLSPPAGLGGPEPAGSPGTTPARVFVLTD